MNRLQTARSIARSERGAAMVMALLILLVLTAFGLTLVGLGMTEVAISSNWRDYTKDFYAAEAGLESGVVGLRNLLSNVSDPSTVTAANLNGIAAPTLNTPGTTFNAYSITLPAPLYLSTSSSGPYQGLFGQVWAYSIRAQVNGQGGTRADLTQVYNYTQVPLFQFGVFYGQGVDLEWAPGPAMTFNGRIHSNSNIYIGDDKGLQVNSYMTSAGGIYRMMKYLTAPACSPCSGNQQPYPPSSYSPYLNNPQVMGADGVYHALSFDSKYQTGFSSQWASPQAWAAQANTTFGGMVKDSAMGVGQITPPIPGLFNNPSNPDAVAHQLIEMPKAGDSSALAGAKMYAQANVRIIDGVATGLTCSTVPAGAIATKSFTDNREGKTVSATQLDVGLLRTNNCLPAQAVLYVASTAAVTSTTLPAVRLVNGSQLPDSGMTVVSQNPVYIQGDYNTHNAAGSTTHPPAAVLADAVTVLSNQWSDANSTKSLPQRGVTAPTNVNAALALGPSTESGQNASNGQLENVIRFLEDWTNGGGTKQPINYSGSIVALWHSQQATARWQDSGMPNNIYEPPLRNWQYDTLFNTIQPPGTPRGILQAKARWSQS